jgi:phosphoribosylformylglycinamidine cyclo-ligase
MSLTYKDSGVNIEAGAQAVNKIKNAVKATYNDNVLTSLGSFGSAFNLKSIISEYDNPVLVQSTDGVGTKLMIAKRMDMFKGIGKDVVSNNVNDMLCMGAKPITFLDYIGCENLQPDQMEDIVVGMANECKEYGIALVGGEMAEMPGVYVQDEVDVVGFVTGVVEQGKVITGQRIVEGDVLVGLESSGLHTNGYSMVRKIIFDMSHIDLWTKPAELGGITIGEALLESHRNYTTPITTAIEQGIDIKGLSHITGGGFIENIPRILPSGLGAKINKNSYEVPALFSYLASLVDIEERELYKTWNMGIGMIAVVTKEESQKLVDIINSITDQKAFIIGEVTGSEGVEIV